MTAEENKYTIEESSTTASSESSSKRTLNKMNFPIKRSKIFFYCTVVLSLSLPIGYHMKMIIN